MTLQSKKNIHSIWHVKHLDAKETLLSHHYLILCSLYWWAALVGFSFLPGTQVASTYQSLKEKKDFLKERKSQEASFLPS